MYDLNGNLKFEGEYLNGEKNGEGKEYDNNRLIFEGEYLNGNKWNGKGKEYYSNGNVKNEYQYINGNFYMSGIIPPNNLILNGFYMSGII